jgi:hypothetical protein
MDLFNAHKEDYVELVRDIKIKLNSVELVQNAVERDRLLKEIKNNLGEAERILRSMKLTKTNVGHDGEALNMMIDTFRLDLRSLLSEYEEKDREIEAGNRINLIVNMDDDDDFNQSHKLTMKLIKTTDTLKEAKGMGETSVNIAHSVLTDLDRQGKQIENSMLTLEGMHDSLDQASLIMTKLWTKMLTTQGIRLLIVLVLILANASILYMRFFWSPSSGGGGGGGKNNTNL